MTRKNTPDLLKKIKSSKIPPTLLYRFRPPNDKALIWYVNIGHKNEKELKKGLNSLVYLLVLPDQFQIKRRESKLPLMLTKYPLN